MIENRYTYKAARKTGSSGILRKSGNGVRQTTV